MLTNYNWPHATTRWANVSVQLHDRPFAELLFAPLKPFADQIAVSGVTVGGSVASPWATSPGLLGQFDEANDYLSRAAHIHEMLGDAYHLALTWLMVTRPAQPERGGERRPRRRARVADPQRGSTTRLRHRAAAGGGIGRAVRAAARDGRRLSPQLARTARHQQ